MTDGASPAIEIRGLTRAFGDHLAIDDITLDVPRGAVYGFLGPNGAGKSTTLGILTGLDRPTSGSARILGLDVIRKADALHEQIGFLPDVPSFYGWMNAREVLELVGSLFGLAGARLESRIDVVLDLAGLTGVDTRVGGYSRGMRQRLGIAQAMINAPSVLLLDEPTSALDPIGRKDVLDIILALKGHATVFFSSHILADVERVCDQVAILDKGNVVLESSIDAIRSRSQSQRLLIRMASTSDVARLAEAIRTEPWLQEMSARHDRIEIAARDLPAAQRALPGIVANLGLTMTHFETAEPTLEEVFVDLVLGDPA